MVDDAVQDGLEGGRAAVGPPREPRGAVTRAELVRGDSEALLNRGQALRHARLGELLRRHGEDGHGHGDAVVVPSNRGRDLADDLVPEVDLDGPRAGRVALGQLASSIAWNAVKLLF